MYRFLNRLRSRAVKKSSISFDMVTEEDIYYCYRLFLKREPDPVGWKFWQDRIRKHRTTLDTLVEGFVNSEEFLLAQFNTQNAHFSLADNQLQLIELNTFKMYVSMSDNLIGTFVAREKQYEPHVTREIQSALKSGDYFIDIGANIGYFTLLAASIVGDNGKVIAFEPNPANCLLLRSSVAENNYKHIDIYQHAVADRAQTFMLEVDGSNGHILSIDSGILLTRTRFFVTSIVLDDLLSDIKKVDLIKIDIEGAEPRALQGMQKIIQQHRPVLVTEFSPPIIEAISKVEPQAYLDSICRLGYDLFVIEDDKHTPLPRDFQQLKDCYFTVGQDHIDLIAYPQ